MLMIWLYFQIAGLGFFLSPLSLVSAFEALLFPLTQLLLYSEECIEFFL